MHFPEIPWESAYFWVALTFGVRLHTEVLVASVKKGAYFRGALIIGGRLVSELYGTCTESKWSETAVDWIDVFHNTEIHIIVIISLLAMNMLACQNRWRNHTTIIWTTNCLRLVLKYIWEMLNNSLLAYCVINEKFHRNFLLDEQDLDWQQHEKFFCSLGLVEHPSGAFYEGNFLNNMMHGYGKYTFENKSVYEGDFFENRYKLIDLSRNDVTT